ncbi:MAG: aminotransferase class V-fold PLP-dependent enzyme [Lachnospiraceae bacterium]|nr:aminotransferase class V-fold PLP-dependent enzyme [Lachnospiraceae bacterium]
MIYLDNAATTFPKPDVVYVAMDKMNREGAVNAGRGSYKLAQEASKLIEETKDLLRRLIYADISASVIFAPSVTIAMNQIVNGLRLRDKAVVYLSPFEHNAVARSVHELAKKKRLIVKEIPINSDLEIDLEKMKYEFAKDKPEAVFCTHVSNVTGYILPVKEIFEESKQYDSVTILDSAQSMGLVEIRSNLIKADIIAFTGHKTLYGPLGIGGFINISGIPLDVFISGGTGSDSLNLEMPDGKESRYEASSCNIVAVAGLNAALKDIDPVFCKKREKELSDYLIDKLSSMKEIKVYLPGNRMQHVGIVSFAVGGLNSEDIGTILDEDFDIAVRTGYHCAPLIHKYLRDSGTLGTVRVGLGQFSMKDDIDKLIMGLREIIDG